MREGGGMPICGPDGGSIDSDDLLLFGFGFGRFVVFGVFGVFRFGRFVGLSIRFGFGRLVVIWTKMKFEKMVKIGESKNRV